MSYFGSIYADQELSHRAKTVYMYLKDRSNADGTCWPSVRIRFYYHRRSPYSAMGLYNEDAKT